MSRGRYRPDKSPSTRELRSEVALAAFDFDFEVGDVGNRFVGLRANQGTAGGVTIELLADFRYDNLTITAVPEPSTVALFVCAGVAGSAWPSPEIDASDHPSGVIPENSLISSRRTHQKPSANHAPPRQNSLLCRHRFTRRFVSPDHFASAGDFQRHILWECRKQLSRSTLGFRAVALERQPIGRAEARRLQPTR